MKTVKKIINKQGEEVTIKEYQQAIANVISKKKEAADKISDLISLGFKFIYDEEDNSRSAE